MHKRLTDQIPKLLWQKIYIYLEKNTFDVDGQILTENEVNRKYTNWGISLSGEPMNHWSLHWNNRIR